VTNGANKFMLGDACDRALDKLIDEIGSFERATGHGYTLIVVPHSSEEKIITSVNGKPTPPDMSPKELLEIAMGRRK
jgi:hypothetical protein